MSGDAGAPDADALLDELLALPPSERRAAGPGVRVRDGRARSWPDGVAAPGRVPRRAPPGVRDRRTNGPIDSVVPRVLADQLLATRGQQGLIGVRIEPVEIDTGVKEARQLGAELVIENVAIAADDAKACSRKSRLRVGFTCIEHLFDVGCIGATGRLPRPGFGQQEFGRTSRAGIGGIGKFPRLCSNLCTRGGRYSRRSDVMASTSSPASSEASQSTMVSHRPPVARATGGAP